MKKKFGFKILSIVVFLLILMSCKTTQENNTPLVFSILYNEEETKPLQEDWLILEEYEELQNVRFEFFTGDNADFENIIIETLESAYIPDIILKVWPKTIENYAVSGLLLPFSDYEYLLPNFMAYIQENNLHNEVDKLRLNNGKYYILPGYQREIQVQQWAYREDLFKMHDLEIPTTYDELFDSLVFLKEIYPESAPISASWGGAHLFAMMGAGYDISAGWAGNRSYNFEKNKWQFSPATENYKELYIFLNRCYRAGILDPDIFAQTFDEYIQKLENGTSFITVTWITSGFNSWNEKLIENGFPDGQWAPLSVLESTMGIKAIPAVNPFRKGLIVPSRVVHEPYFEDLLKFLDWAIYSEEGMTLSSWGVEGLTYEITSTGKIFMPEIETPQNPEGTVDIMKEYGLNTIFNLNENKEYEDYKKPVEIVEFLDRSLASNDSSEIYPTIVLDDSSIQIGTIIEERLTPYVADMSLRFITGDVDITEEWDNYLLALEERGYKILEEIWNSTLEK